MPFTLEFDGSVLRTVLRGTLGREDLERLASAVEEFEARHPGTPDRLNDLSALEGIAVGFDELNALALRRQASLARPIRSALVAASAIQVGYARMYQTLSEHPLITVRIFPTVEDALDWLSTPP